MSGAASVSASHACGLSCVEARTGERHHQRPNTMQASLRNLTAIVALMALSSVAGAADAQEIDVATETDAAALYRHGKARFAAGDIPGAFAAYQRSCKLQ